MTGKQEVLAKALAKIPPPSIAEAGRIAGYAHRSTASIMSRSPTVAALVSSERDRKLDSRKDLVGRLGTAVGRASRLLDQVELDPQGCYPLMHRAGLTC